MASHVRTPKRAGQLSDKKLAKLAREYRLTKAQAKVEEEHAKELAAQILAELKVRKVDTADVDGMTLVKRSRAVRKVDLVALADTVGRSLFARLTAPALDTARWNNAINTGLVTPEQVAAVETEIESAPWVEVSEVV